jgi:hypothetical protein
MGAASNVAKELRFDRRRADAMRAGEVVVGRPLAAFVHFDHVESVPHQRQMICQADARDLGHRREIVAHAADGALETPSLIPLTLSEPRRQIAVRRYADLLAARSAS